VNWSNEFKNGIVKSLEDSASISFRKIQDLATPSVPRIPRVTKEKKLAKKIICDKRLVFCCVWTKCLKKFLVQSWQRKSNITTQHNECQVQ